MENELILEKDDSVILINNETEFGKIKMIDDLPLYSEKANSEAINQLKLFSGEFFKGLANIPGKTLEITFKPEVTKGLKNGTFELLRTKNGEILTDAIDKKGKIVGKARVKSNSIKQITSAGFQLLSFAVAQSHLDEITSKLRKIEDLCKEIQKDHKISEISEMETDVVYLQGIIEKIRIFSDPEKISTQQKNQIEVTIKNLIKYKIYVKNQFNELIKDIQNQRDEDTFGSENTYNSLYRKQEKHDFLIQKIELINKIYILLKLIIGYIDPLKDTFSLIDANNFFLDIQNLQNRYIDAIRKSVDKFFKSVTFNVSDTLSLRSNMLLLITKNQNNTFERIGNYRDDVLNKLDRHLEHLSNPTNIRYALKFDHHGEIESASLI